MLPVRTEGVGHVLLLCPLVGVVGAVVVRTLPFSFVPAAILGLLRSPF